MTDQTSTISANAKATADIMMNTVDRLSKDAGLALYTVDILEKLAKALGVPVAELFK